MRLSTRFGIGAALAVLPLVGVVVYNMERMRELAATNQRLTERHAVGVRVSSGIITRLERLTEFHGKYVVSRDTGYVQKVAEILSATQAELQRLVDANLTAGERQALGFLMEEFEDFVEFGPELLVELPPDVVSSQLEELIARAVAVQNQARASADSEAATAVRVREETQRTALGVAGVAAILSISLILLTVRSLRRRLDLFIHGTRAVSQGKFSFQLDATVGDETGQMARAFNSMVQELAQLERIKADFISSVSHELRTPLVAMLETNHLLLDEVPGPLTPKQKHMLQLNTQAAQRLSNMITDLLDLSRLKAGIRYSLSEQDLAQLTQSAVSELEAMALERGIELRAQVGAMLKANCDPDRFVQVVQNLVENALKYTPSQGTVEVSLETKPSKHLPQEALSGDHPRDYALLTVEDSGKGIPEVDRARVFEKFFRREGLPSDGGTGLGLAICREIIEAHGGNIWVSDSKKLGGAALHVAFPIELSPTTKRRHKGATAA